MDYRCIVRKNSFVKALLSNFLLILTPLVSTSGCFVIKHQFKDTEGMSMKSKYNDDNVVYKTNRSFTFRSILVSKGDTLINEYSTLKVIPGHWFGQTKIKWKYQKAVNDTTSYNSEVSGLIETPDNIWFHPPRNGNYALSETMPFPDILIHAKNLNQKLSKGSFYIGSGWNDAIKGTYEQFYTYLGEEILNGAFGSLTTYKVRLESIKKDNPTRRAETIINYSDSLGLVVMDGLGLEGDRFSLQLIAVNP